MAKDYLCKDCIENNNGWCNKRKFNGLKKITECEFHIVELVEPEEVKEVDVESYKQFGKRENFFNIQQQLLAINNQCNTYEEKWNAVVKVMESIGKLLSVGEEIHGVTTDYLIDEDIVNNSKKINDNWIELMK